MSLHGSTNRAVVIEKATAVKNTVEDVNIEKVQEKKLVNDNMEGRFLGAAKILPFLSALVSFTPPSLYWIIW